MSFSQQGSRAICILSANGTISNVTLRQPSTSGGTLTYEVWPSVLCNCLCNFNIRSYCISNSASYSLVANLQSILIFTVVHINIVFLFECSVLVNRRYWHYCGKWINSGKLKIVHYSIFNHFSKWLVLLSRPNLTFNFLTWLTWFTWTVIYYSPWNHRSGEIIEFFPLSLQGRFEILSLSGSYMPTENAGTKSRSGGMSVSLASPDGRVVGGGLAGLLIAAGPVQVTSFLRNSRTENKR